MNDVAKAKKLKREKKEIKNENAKNSLSAFYFYDLRNTGGIMT
jgi:hypothetical protein